MDICRHRRVHVATMAAFSQALQEELQGAPSEGHLYVKIELHVFF